MNMIMANCTDRPRGEFVSIRSAGRHAQMEELFGLPKVTRPHTDEVFGPYTVDGEARFWRYSPADDAWTVLTCPAQPSPLLVPVNGESYDGMREAFDAMRACPPTSLPSDLNTRTAREPFVFECWQFFWVFYPELTRWELAPGGRA